MKIKYGLIIFGIIILFSFLSGCSGVAEGGINQMLYSEKTSLKVTQINLENTINPISKQKALRIEIDYLVWNTTNKNLEILRICEDFKDGNNKRIIELKPEYLCITLPRTARSKVLMTISLNKNKVATFHTSTFLNYIDSEKIEKIFVEIMFYGQQNEVRSPRNL